MYQSAPVTPQATVDAEFSDQQTQLQTICREQGAAPRGSWSRPWYMPKDFTADLLDPQAITQAAFSRQSLNQAYEQYMQTAGGSSAAASDAIATQLQIARVQSEERAFRMRHASLVRCLAHSAARRTGLADSQAVENVTKQVERIILAGGL